MNTNLALNNVLLIGASGGIAQACLAKLEALPEVSSITTISRNDIKKVSNKTHCITLPQPNEASIMACCDEFPNDHFDLVINTTGVLHNAEAQLTPEKKLEDITEQALTEYFHVNSILPALWLRGLVTKVRRKHSNVVMFSARVGSISDNQLGGWYGYRASKSALNMLLKTAQIEYQRRAPGCNLIAWHPGTVDTHLSKPFQRNVKPEKLFDPAYSVECLLKALAAPPATSPPWYLDWQNKIISW